MKSKASQQSASPKFIGSKSVQAQLRNINEDFALSLNLPENAQVHATLVKKAARAFETKIEVSVWRNSIFCHAIAETPEMSLQVAKRKMTRLVSDLHDRKRVSQKHQKPKFEKRVEDDIRAL